MNSGPSVSHHFLTISIGADTYRPIHSDPSVSRQPTTIGAHEVGWPDDPIEPVEPCEKALFVEKGLLEDL